MEIAYFLDFGRKLLIDTFPHNKIIALLNPIALSGQRPKLLLNQTD